MSRAVSISQLMSTKFKAVPFDGEFKDLIGCPELRGAWLIWGLSGHGKTTFVMLLAKYLSKFCRVAYNTIEEGISLSIQDSAARVGLDEAKGMILLDKESIADLRLRLKKRKSPDVIVIDSAQYTGLSPMKYKEFVNEFPNKLFIFISHAKGKEPKGGLAESILYDAFVKIHVEGYVATVRTSRYLKGGSKPYTIWKDGADEYWSNIQ